MKLLVCLDKVVVFLVRRQWRDNSVDKGRGTGTGLGTFVDWTQGRDIKTVKLLEKQQQEQQ